MFSFRAGETLPDWCELRAFSIENLALGSRLDQTRHEPCERILMTRGRCLVSAGPHAMVLRAGQFFDVPDTQAGWSVEGTTDDAEFIRLAGRWGPQIAGCGIWTLEDDPDANNAGDRVDYAKRTRMDSHYHDYDEYWFILDGAADVVVSSHFERVAIGDCVVIGAGRHHDMPRVYETMRGAFFETSLLGQKRLGHLWAHTHGPAEPAPGRE